MENRIIKTGAEQVKNMAFKIANESPNLKNLNQEQLEQIAKIVITQRLSNELNEQVNIANINLKVEMTKFLMTAGHSGSIETKKAYTRGLKELQVYCSKMNINLLLMNYREADDFIVSLKGAPKSKRLIISAVSSFYSFLERRYNTVKNPVRGTKARPGDKPVKELTIPDDDEMVYILNELPELEKAAVYIMAYRGLRVGALKKLRIWGTSYYTSSKGKNLEGEFSDDILLHIRASELNNKTPFSSISTNALKLRVWRATKKLYEKGLIKDAYSAHDFRHYFAVSEYKKDKDIYKLSKLLDHTNITITQNYLRSMKIAV